jgi:hypothetical protein
LRRRSGSAAGHLLQACRGVTCCSSPITRFMPRVCWCRPTCWSTAPRWRASRPAG